MRFELTVLGICNPLRWAAPPPVHKLVSVAGIEPTLERPKRSVIPFHHTELVCGTWCQTRTDIVLRVKEMHNLSAQPGNLYGAGQENRTPRFSLEG